MSECEKYLGLPMPNGKSKVGTFKELQEKIVKQVMGGKRDIFLKRGMKFLSKL